MSKSKSLARFVVSNVSPIGKDVISVVSAIATKQAPFVSNAGAGSVLFQMKLGYALAAQAWQNALLALRSKLSTINNPSFVKRAIEIDVAKCFIRKSKSKSSAQFVERNVSLACSIEQSAKLAILKNATDAESAPAAKSTRSFPTKRSNSVRVAIEMIWLPRLYAST